MNAHENSPLYANIPSTTGIKTSNWADAQSQEFIEPLTIVFIFDQARLPKIRVLSKFLQPMHS